MAENAGIIIRVSTTGQLDNTSPDGQLHQCREYCKARGYSVVAEQTEAISGAFVLARSGFNVLLEMAARETISVIVADIPDRLGRGDAIAKLELLAQLNNARIEYAQPGRDTSTAEGLIQHAAEQMVSGIERMNTRRRTMNGRRSLANAGRVIASGLRIYGYDYVSRYDERGRKIECRLSIRDDEAPIVIKIYEWCAFEGLSSHAIARRLREMGVPTVTDTDKTHTNRKRKGYAEWAPHTVRGILANETYAGRWYYAKHDVRKHDDPDGVYSTTRTRDKSDWIGVPVPEIVSRELFDLVQEQLKRNSARRPKPAQREYLVRTRIRCARCGSIMVGQCTHRTRQDGTEYTYRYYRCHKNRDEYGTDRCFAPNVNGEQIDWAVWQWVKSSVLDDVHFFQSIAEDRADAERSRKIITDTILVLDTQDQKAKQKIDKLLDLYAGGDIDKPTYLVKRQEVERDITKRSNERAELTERLNTYRVLSEAQEANLNAYREAIRQGAEAAGFEDKRKILNWLRIECLYDDRTRSLVISGVLGEKQIDLDSVSLNDNAVCDRQELV